MASRSIRLLIFAFVLLAISVPAFAQIGISISFGPPPLPVYEQPPCPEEGYLWTPGYWAFDYDYNDYYWVPGTWVLAPEPNLFWTPAYWGWQEGAFRFYDGYWGPQVGFYGGINYGFGYFGEGYEGGRWEHDRFFYNRTVNNVNVTNIHNVYNTTIINNNRTVNRVSYNGGNGGVEARPTPQQEAVARERHIPPVAAQKQHIQQARSNRQLRASENHGKPRIAATAKPADFRGHAVAAREAGGPYTPPANRQQARSGGNAPASNGGRNDRPNDRGNVYHPKDLPPRDRPAPVNTGNAQRDRKYQQQQDKMYSKQDQERQKLQQRQEQDHQKIARQHADDARKQQTEQRHQQQTQQLQQRHEQQRQQLEHKQQPRQDRPQPQKEQHPPEKHQ